MSTRFLQIYANPTRSRSVLQRSIFTMYTINTASRYIASHFCHQIGNQHQFLSAYTCQVFYRYKQLCIYPQYTCRYMQFFVKCTEYKYLNRYMHGIVIDDYTCLVYAVKSLHTSSGLLVCCMDRKNAAYIFGSSYRYMRDCICLQNSLQIYAIFEIAV